MENKKNNKLTIILLVVIVLIVGVAVTLFATGKIKLGDKKETNENSNTQEEVYNTNFDYDKYSINLISQVKDTNAIYAFDLEAKSIPQNTGSNVNVYARYTNGDSLKIATIETKENYIVELRTLTFENNKLYFIIVPQNKGDKAEIAYIDLNDLANGATSIDDFSSVFNEDNYWEFENSIYASQIYTNGDDIYYTSFTDKSLKSYNMSTKATKTVTTNVNWYDFYVDSVNDKIFYIQNSKLYVADLDGKNSVELEYIYNGSNFWTKARYNGSPLFETNPDLSDMGMTVNLYTFNYKTNTFELVKENISSSYKVQYNEIVEDGLTTNTEFSVKSYFVK